MDEEMNKDQFSTAQDIADLINSSKLMLDLIICVLQSKQVITREEAQQMCDAVNAERDRLREKAERLNASFG